MKKRKILGIDYGDFSIGLAIFDLETDFIFPYKTIFREKANVLRKSIREIVEIVKIENITDIVIGLPLNADGTEGERVEKVKNFAHMLKNGIVNANVAHANSASLCRRELCERHVLFDADSGLNVEENANVVGANVNVVGAKANAVGAKQSEPSCTGELYDPPIYFQDERLTTVEAKTILAERGIKKSDWKKTIDQIAAELILQDFKQANILKVGGRYEIY